jgi:Nucleotidyl transferase AbiEii toxin, Type IV TA system
VSSQVQITAQPIAFGISHCGLKPNIAKDSKFQCFQPEIYRERRPPLYHECEYRLAIPLGKDEEPYDTVRDFYDIWVLSRASKFKDDRLARAIAATFARRNTEIPSEPPDALTLAFAEDVTKVQQWNSFAEDVAFKLGTLSEVVKDLAAFLMPRAREVRNRS